MRESKAGISCYPALLATPSLGRARTDP